MSPANFAVTSVGAGPAASPTALGLLRGPEAPNPLGYRKSSRLSAKKKEKDPDKPKRPTSGWLRYVAHVRKEQKGKMESKDMLVYAGEQWKKMSDADKKPYNDAYAKDKAVYEEALAAYNADHKAPKRPPTAYILFSGDVRESSPGMDIIEASKAAGEKWKTLTDEQKVPYQEKAAKLMKAYEVELAAWEAKQKARGEKLGDEADDGEDEATAHSHTAGDD